MLAHERKLLETQINTMYASLAARIEVLEARLKELEGVKERKSGKNTHSGVDKS